jgi:CrcB protein
VPHEPEPTTRQELGRIPLDPDRVDLEATVHQRRASWTLLVVIGFAGAAGALARYGMGAALPDPANGFPWGTFAVNLSGSFALGLVLMLLLEHFPRARLARPLLATGFIGAFTTFSTYAIGADELLRHQAIATFVAYGFGSIVGGLATAFCGVLTARFLTRLEAYLRRSLPR